MRDRRRVLRLDGRLAVSRHVVPRPVLAGVEGGPARDVSGEGLLRPVAGRRRHRHAAAATAAAATERAAKTQQPSTLTPYTTLRLQSTTPTSRTENHRPTTHKNLVHNTILQPKVTTQTYD